MIFANNKIVFGGAKNEDGNFLKSMNIASKPSKIGTQFNENGSFFFLC
tara:strand:- start:449 stop:592 length:144 start_codon:yes stop_codon:yes gene_type:complete